MNTDDIDKTMFEQFWVHLRHIESERMWIMGIWLGITGVMLKESWPPLNTNYWWLQAPRYILIAHSIVTFAILLITFKLQLTYSIHEGNIKRIAKNASTKEYQLESYWDRIQKHKVTVFVGKRCLTLGGITSAILITGIVFDLTSMTQSEPGDLFTCCVPVWMIFSLFCLLLFSLYQLIFWIFDVKLPGKAKEKVEKELVEDASATKAHH
jgi:disulfide bond formation protein DsbB